jgi:hypothetical protein
VICAGYRDQNQLRIRDESEAIRKKALSKRSIPVDKPRSLTLSLDLQARDAFFAYYVTGTSKTWDFLKPFYHPTDSPDHLTLAIDAVSLAYLSHQLYSDTALVAARQRYVAALRMTNKALQCPKVAAKNTTLLATLLLDLFEKITNNEPRIIQSWTGHVKGALALVELRGLDQFHDPNALRVLVRLSTNLLINCVATSNPVPKELKDLRAYAGKLLDTDDPKWRLMDLMVKYTDLQAEISESHLSVALAVQRSLELDRQYEALFLDVPPAWQYETTITDIASERILEHRFDTYSARHITQTWNVLRLIRILLNEFVLNNHFEARATDILAQITTKNIEKLGRDICASVSQYVDCLGAARNKLASSISEPDHSHSPNQNFDCYTLIFPLYVAAHSKCMPIDLKTWVIKELHHIGSHFSIRNAELVARMLEDGTGEVNPWAVYAMLGGYAFAA